MKWKKHGRNSRRRSYYEYWDCLDSENNLLAFVRHDTRKREFRVFANDHEHHMLESQYCKVGPFSSFTEAKGHVVAYFINKRLDEAWRS
jgi:hypothetical protein